MARYAAGWFTAAGVVALLAVGALRLAERHAPSDPLRAVLGSTCVLLQPGGRASARTRPPVAGPPAAAAAAGTYRRSPSRQRLIGALRRGSVVVQYRQGLPRRQLRLLDRSFGAPSRGRILTPDSSGMSYVVTASAWRRLLGCRRVDGRVLSALRAFARRFAGQGPDVRRR